MLNLPCFWVAGPWAAWQYISRVRANRLFLDEVLELPLWTEKQITALIELRSSHTGISPNFGELVLPRQYEASSYETIDDRYRLTWMWFRSITRVLARQNLLVRRTLGGSS